MEKKVKRRKPAPWLALLICTFLMCASCGMPGVRTSSKEKIIETEESIPPAGPQQSVADNIGALGFPGNGNLNLDFTYAYGLSNGNPSDSNSTIKLYAEYTKWKNAYIVEDNATGFKRVQRDMATGFDTVSEGIAYGMLLALYFDDQETFDGLHQYAQLHSTRYEAGSDSRKCGLMHWRVNAAGVNISEFDEPVPHGVSYVRVIDHGNNEFELVKPLEYHFQPVGSASTPSVLEIGGNTYLKSNMYDRKNLSSATDADVDMAAALAMAHNRWGKSLTQGGSLKINYLKDAVEMIDQICAKDVFEYDGDKCYYIQNGCLWAGAKGWNPCYFTPAWWRIFPSVLGWGREYSTDPDVNIQRCYQVFDNMFALYGIIDNANGSSGLFPDWVDTRDGTAKWASYNSNEEDRASDRVYYLDLDGDGIIDERVNDGEFNFDDGFDMMSFNSYYDAVRVPWRLATDFSWYGDNIIHSTHGMLREMALFFYNKNLYPSGPIDPATGQPTADINNDLVDGYAINGAQWKYANRDGFNEGIGGRNISTTFITMNASPTLAMMDSNNALRFYNAAWDYNDYDDPMYNYYGNSVRLLSLLYLTGKMYNYWDLGSMKAPPRRPAEIVEIGPLSVDISTADFAAYGREEMQLNDRVKLYNADESARANVGAGWPDSVRDGYMRLGVDSVFNDAICGLSSLEDHQETNSDHYNGWVLGSGLVNVRGPVSRYSRIVRNMGVNPECLDFRADSRDFIYNLNNPLIATVQYPGYPQQNVLYGDVSVSNNGASITFTSGWYFMHSFTTEPDAKVYFDTSAGPVVLFVADGVYIKSRTEFLKAESQGMPIRPDASKIMVISGSPANRRGCYIAPHVNWSGTLVAPCSTVNVDIVRPFTGAIWGHKVTIHQESKIHYVPFDFSPFQGAEGGGQNPLNKPDLIQPASIDLTGSSSGQELTVDGQSSFLIKTGQNGVIQINKPYQHDVKISINNGPQLSTPFDWGGPFSGLSKQSEVLFTITTSQPEKITLSWW